VRIVMLDSFGLRRRLRTKGWVRRHLLRMKAGRGDWI
jgi:hypothetical protein